MSRTEPRLFSDVHAWIEHARSLTSKTRDLDNVVLFAGEPGNGKSTVAFQLARAWDPSFDEERVAFDIPSFLEVARSLKPGQAVLADEIPLNKRNAMTGETRDFLFFLQVCRGLNLHILICFPHAPLFDSAVLMERVRYRVDVALPSGVDGPRVAHVTERVAQTLRDAYGEERTVVRWDPAVDFRFHANRGPLWEAYLGKKLLAARRREAEARGTSIDEEVAEQRSRTPASAWKKAPPKPRGSRVDFAIRPTSPLAATFPERVVEPGTRSMKE